MVLIICLSTDLNSLPFEYFEGSMVVVSSILIIFQVAVIRLIINSSFIRIVFSGVIIIVGLCTFEIISECWILVEGNGFEFSIGIEAKDHGEAIEYEADDGICVDVLVHVGVGLGVDLILDRREKEDHEGDCEVNADEDIHHDDLIAALVLDGVEDRDQEDPEDCLKQKLTHCDEVEQTDQCLQSHHYLYHCFVGGGLFCSGWYLLAETHLNIMVY